MRRRGKEGSQGGDSYAYNNFDEGIVMAGKNSYIFNRVSDCVTNINFCQLSCCDSNLLLKISAMLSALDDAVGDVYDALKRKKMLENSIILFTTDNGGPPNGFDYNAANNFPLRLVIFFSHM